MSIVANSDNITTYLTTVNFFFAGYPHPLYAQLMAIERFGEKLKQLRLAKKLSQQALAAKFGLQSHSYISEVETGQKPPSLDLIELVVQEFDVSFDEALDDRIDLPEEKVKPQG